VLKRFSQDEIDILTICERNGWTYTQWFALPENEQIDRLAMLHRRQTYLDSILRGFDKRIEDGLGIEPVAYISTLIERHLP